MTVNVLLYYNFSPIADPHAFIAEHKRWCANHNLLGRIYVSEEGINGTLAGLQADTDAYQVWLRSHPNLAQTEFKTDATDRVPFAKLIVKYRPEIVSIHYSEPLDPKEGGRHLSPAEWRAVLESNDPDVVVIDARNDYESAIGHFEGALLPDRRNFHEFPDWVDQAAIPKDKKILMYCTGGIRCEKFSVLMKKKGYADVNQLHGGILTYAKEEGGAHFKGKCFVFDDRLAVPVNPAETEPIAHCEISGRPADTYLNCANMDCNRLFVVCPEAAHLLEGCCSEACRQAPRRRPFDAATAFVPFRKWYTYFGPEFKQR